MICQSRPKAVVIEDDLRTREMIDEVLIYSARGLMAPSQSLIATRPARMLHHSTSSAALVGGGAVPEAGEISLAHHAVLFLDDPPEFNRVTLEMVRQPLEGRYVTILRRHSTIRFPASTMLVATIYPPAVRHRFVTGRHRRAVRGTRRTLQHDPALATIHASRKTGVGAGQSHLPDFLALMNGVK